uniref:LRRCT domain-containing protein n=1 Tax=Meloidogyne hapla TaxID=6305 RepID=A0A1I8BAT0_MELHA
MTNKNIYYFTLLSLIAMIHLSNCCPDQIQQFCSCLDQFDGVLLNCTAPSFGKNISGEFWATNLMKACLLKLLSIRGNAETTRESSIFPILSDNLFQGLYIKRLELVGCGINVVQKGAFRGLESVLQEIAVTGNRIQELSFNAFNQMNDLIRLDLSDNYIDELKSEHALSRIAKLNDINLSHNKITAIHKSFFDNVKHSLQTINLGHNLLEEVPASSLRGFRILMALHLHNNNLKNLPQLSFMNLPVLSLLNLAANQIRSIHRQAFLNAPQLRFLYLSANQLSEVQPFQFSSFERLEMLDLSNNKIEDLPNDTFAGLPLLKQLYLGENTIDRLQPEAFSSNSSIIRSVDASTFRGNPSLAMLDLSHNEIIDLAPGTFLSQLNLLLVDLSNNKILRTPYGAFGRRVATVLLKDNPLVCVEKIHMLQQGNGLFIPNSNDAICGEYKDNDVSTKTNVSTGLISDQETSIMPITTEEDQEEEENDNEPLTSPSPFVQQVEENPQNFKDNKHNINSHGNGSSIITPGRIKPIRIIPNAQHTEWGVTAFQSNKALTSPSKETNKPIALTDRIIGDSDYTTLIESSSTSSSLSRQNVKGTERIKPLSTTTEVGINPRVIYPHPVPFLKPAPKMHTATHVENDENGNPILVPTLPPSILIAENSWHLNQHIPLDENKNDNNIDNKIAVSNDNNHSTQNYSTIENNEKIEEFPLLLSKTPVITEENSLQHIGVEPTEPEKRSNNRRMLPTIVIVICIGTVAVVMCSVFVGLCVARRRKLRQLRSETGISLATAGLVGTSSSSSHSPISNSFMNAAGAARAAQMGGFCYISGPNQQRQYETLKRGGIQQNFGGTLNRLSATQEDIYGWLYTPCGYNAYRK